MSELQDKIFQLIEQKDVEELTPDELDLVLTQMTIQAYHQQRSALLAAQGLMHKEQTSLTPDPGLLGLLQAQVEEKEKTVIVPVWRRMAHHKIPTYWAAVAALLLLGFVAFWPKPDPIEVVKYVEKEVPVYATVYDTVYLNNDQSINREVVEKIIYVNRPTQRDTELINSINLVESNAIVVPQIPDIEQIEQSFGNQPISKDELNQFRVSL